MDIHAERTFSFSQLCAVWSYKVLIWSSVNTLGVYTSKSDSTNSELSKPGMLNQLNKPAVPYYPCIYGGPFDITAVMPMMAFLFI